ncbi:MAG: methylmalonyl-CoA mutase [Planctomycetes bacterium]|nr:methylmalonyl-CoA mutase [Planctomycetota bacterium]
MSPARILIAKPGLDGHDVGARVVCLALRDAGFEVIYTGLRRTPAEIAACALEEGVDCVGLSILSGAHLVLCEELKRELAKLDLPDLPWIVGGNIPAEDREPLEAAGAAAVMPTATPLEEIVRVCRTVLESPRGGKQ